MSIQEEDLDKEATLTKSKLITKVAERGGLPRKQVEKVINTVFDAMASSLIQGNRIEMRGFGTFSVKHYDPYVGRNPRTGDEVHVPAKRAIKFRVGKALRDMVNVS